jgi:Protein of unknown function (DUF2786)
VTATDAKLAKIRKIIAKAEDPAVTPEEAEAYNTKAAELIAAYGIDRAMLAASEPSTDTIDSLEITFDAPYSRDKADLLWAVAAPLRCTGILRQRWNGTDDSRVFSMHLIGFKSDLERAELVFTSLLVQVAHGLASTHVPAWDTPAAFRRGWIRGFCQVVERRLYDAEKTAIRQAGSRAPTEATDSGRPSVDLVLADRSAQVARAVSDAFPDVPPVQPRNLSSFSGHRAGVDAGLFADLGQARVGRTRALGDGGVS